MNRPDFGTSARESMVLGFNGAFKNHSGRNCFGWCFRHFKFRSVRSAQTLYFFSKMVVWTAPISASLRLIGIGTAQVEPLSPSPVIAVEKAAAEWAILKQNTHSRSAWQDRYRSERGCCPYDTDRAGNRWIGIHARLWADCYKPNKTS